MRDRAPDATHFVVFDACRNSLRLKETGSKALVQSKGFEPLRTVSGMLVAYATAEGETASDVGSGAGPYSTALAEEIVKPGVEAVTMFRNVQLRVRAAINQEPWLSYGALNEVWFAGREEKTTIPAPPTPPAPARESEAAEAWDRAKNATSAAVLEAFIARYKDTFYAELARARVQDMKRQLSAAPPPPPPPSAGAWVELGCKQVALFGRDRDAVPIGRQESHSKAIRLHVRGADVEMLDLKVIYANGEPDDIPVRPPHQAGRTDASARSERLGAQHQPRGHSLSDDPQFQRSCPGLRRGPAIARGQWAEKRAALLRPFLFSFAAAKNIPPWRLARGCRGVAVPACLLIRALIRAQATGRRGALR
jgi:hypothetical protein